MPLKMLGLADAEAYKRLIVPAETVKVHVFLLAGLEQSRRQIIGTARPDRFSAWLWISKVVMYEICDEVGCRERIWYMTILGAW